MTVKLAGERRRLGRIKVVTSFVLALSLFLTVLYYPLFLAPLDSAAQYLSQVAVDSSHSSQEPPWHGWASIEHMVVFGDSITSTKFNFRGEQPSQSNPLGNPDFPGSTSANGPNWVGYLTGTYNATFLKTLNLAAGGATVDGEIVSGIYPIVKSFKDQIFKWWLPRYVSAPSDFPWKADNTLFVPFLGTNDIGRAFLNGWTDELGRAVDQYHALLDTLYENGARNFLIMNTLPLDRAPFIERLNEKSRRELESLVYAFNADLNHVASTFADTYADATVLRFDTHAFLSKLMDDPCVMKETCSLKVMDTYCRVYMHEENDPNRFDAECGYPISEYFWLNTLHPSSRVHDAMAKAIALHLDTAE